MALSKKEQQEKDLKAVMAKDIGSKNPIFSPEHIAELHSMFSLYADPRQRRADIRDVLMTAKTLGLDVKNELVYRALEDISYGSGGDALDFESFLRELTAKIVHSSLTLRETHSVRMAEETPSLSWMCKVRVNWILTI
jgi:Ca2+-binding EF-hand superfamily protein